MWAKLGSEFINLDHIIRVKMSKSWNKDGDCLVAEVETLLNGEIKQLIRYRGAEAEVLQAALETQTVEVAPPLKSIRSAGGPTMHDVAIPATGLADTATRCPKIPTLADI